MTKEKRVSVEERGFKSHSVYGLSLLLGAYAMRYAYDRGCRRSSPIPPHFTKTPTRSHPHTHIHILSHAHAHIRVHLYHGAAWSSKAWVHARILYHMGACGKECEHAAIENTCMQHERWKT